jgi:hypothetical protein
MQTDGSDIKSWAEHTPSSQRTLSHATGTLDFDRAGAFVRKRKKKHNDKVFKANETACSPYTNLEQLLKMQNLSSDITSQQLPRQEYQTRVFISHPRNLFPVLEFAIQQVSTD